MFLSGVCSFLCTRKPKTKKKKATLPDWATYYNQNIKANKKKLLVKRHKQLMAGMKFTVDKEMNNKVVVWNGKVSLYLSIYLSAFYYFFLFFFVASPSRF
jgi:hypothetical protein